MKLANRKNLNTCWKPSRNEPRLRNSKSINFIVNLAFADSAYAQNLTTEAELYCKAALAFAREEGIWLPYSLS